MATELSNRKFLMTLVGLVAALAVVLAFTSFLESKNVAAEVVPNRSVYNNEPSGYGAWFKMLERSGRAPHVWRRSFEQLKSLKTPATMVVIQPKVQARALKKGRARGAYPVSTFAEDGAALKAWVSKGNTLVLLDEMGENAPALHWMMAFNERSDKGALKSSKEQRENPDKDTDSEDKPGRQSQNEKEIKEKETAEANAFSDFPALKLPSVKDLSQQAKRQQARLMLDSNAPSRLKYRVKGELKTSYKNLALTITEKGERALLNNRQDAQPRVLLKQVGQGLLIVGTVPDVASNMYLYDKKLDNYQFFTNLLTMSGKPVYINEYVHGYIETPDLYSYYLGTPLGHLFFQLLFFFILILWLSFLRWQPVRKPTEPGLKVTMEAFVCSMATLYRRGNAPALALKPLFEQLDLLMRRQHHVDLLELFQSRSYVQGEVPAKLGVFITALFSDNKECERVQRSVVEAYQVVYEQRSVSEAQLLILSQDLSLIQESFTYGRVSELSS